MQQSDAPTAPQPPSSADEAASTMRGGAAYVADIERRLAPYFARTEPRQRALAYLRGLLGSAERKNGWQLAEATGYREPRAIQRVLDRSAWNADAARDAVVLFGGWDAASLAGPVGRLAVTGTGRRSAPS